MKPIHFALKKTLSRRSVLRGAGVALGLPLLDAMTPVFAAGSGSVAKAKRFVGVSYALGLHGPNLTPSGEGGTGYKPSRYLKSMQDIRKDFTVVSGSSHPGVTGGHTAEGSIFSACPNERGGTARNTISLDQLMAKHLGHHTRFPALVLNTGRSTSPSYTENGAMIPAEQDPRRVFSQLFVDDSPEEKKRQAELMKRGQSVMDVIAGEAKALQRELGHGDREKLDNWFTSIREFEQRLKANEDWVHKSKPKMSKDKRPNNVDDNNAAAIQKAMLDVMALALQTDSTRFITLHCSSNGVSSIEGVDESYHGLSHHGRDDEKLRQLALVEQAMIDEWANFLRTLKARDQGGHSLLDETMVLLTSNLGNASAHDNRNMPVLFGGGGFKHGRHLAFDQKRNYALPKLYVNALQQLGMETDTFSTTTGTMSGLV